MNILEIFILAFGLATDATAVSLACSASHQRAKSGQLILAALYFGLFQAAMPIVGFFLGSSFAGLIKSFDHWIAFFALSFVGGKMIFDKEETSCQAIYGHKNLVLLAVATSIDALIVGITFSFINVNLWLAIIVIGLVTFLLSTIAGFFAKSLSFLEPRVLKIIGGAAIVLIGLKILVEHLF